jgi:hypothetical protein
MNSPKDKGPHSLKEALQDAVKRLPHEEQKRVRKILREKGVLKEEPALKDGGGKSGGS